MTLLQDWQRSTLSWILTQEAQNSLSSWFWKVRLSPWGFNRHP
jgi:hypothetical protein